MKVLFIVKKSWRDPLGVMYLSSMLKKHGHDTATLWVPQKDFIEKIKEFSPDILAYSTSTGVHNFYVDLNRQIKKKINALSVFGGPHPTFFPEMIDKEGVDAVCIGEGEYAFAELVDKLEKGENITNVQNWWVKQDGVVYKNPVRPLIEPLDEIPFPDRDIMYKKNIRHKVCSVITARGCPYNCSYCFNHVYKKIYDKKGKIIRRRSVGNVIEELQQIKNKFASQSLEIYFVDDTFNSSEKWLKEFLSEYKKKIDLPFSCSVRANLITPEIVEQLKDAKCKHVAMGVEAGDEFLRNNILRRNMSDKQIIDACNILRKKGLKFVTQNMIGIPGDTLDTMLETLKLNIKCKPDVAGIGIFQPYPRTELGDLAIKKGMFSGDYDKIPFTDHHTSPLTFEDKRMKQQVERLHNLFSMVCCVFPFAYPIVPFLIKLPLNFVYRRIAYLEALRTRYIQKWS